MHATIPTIDPRSRRGRIIGVAAITFAIILVARWEIVDSPPWWDAALSLFPEAIFLADHDFDIVRLRDHEPQCLGPRGGSRTYVTSVMPTLLAMLMRTLPSPRAVIIVFHLFTFGCAVAIAWTAARLAPARIPTWARALFAATVLTSPILCAQVDMLGMEIPMTACALASAYCFAKRRHGLAAVGGVAAFLVKNSGLVVTLGSLATAMIGMAVQRRSGGWRRWLTPLFLQAAALGLELSILWWSQTVGFLTRGRNPLWWSLLWCPELVALFVVAWIAAMMLAWRGRDAVASELEEDPTPTLSLMIATATVASLAMTPYLPRYITIAVPFLYLAATPAILPRAAPRIGAATALGGLLCWNLANWNGGLLPNQWKWMGKSGQDIPVGEGAHLERSHEYLPVHRATIDLVRAVESKSAGRPIVAGHPFDLALALPQLGYVDHGVDGFSVNGLSAVTYLFSEVDRLLEANPPRVIFVVAPTHYYQDSSFAFPDAAPGDELFFSNESLGMRAYMKLDPPLLLDPKARAEWYRQRLWHGASILPWLDDRVARGLHNQAINDVREWVRPDDDPIKILLLADLFDRKGDRVAAADMLLRLPIEDLIELALRDDAPGIRTMRGFEAYRPLLLSSGNDRDRRDLLIARFGAAPHSPALDRSLGELRQLLSGTATKLEGAEAPPLTTSTHLTTHAIALFQSGQFERAIRSSQMATTLRPADQAAARLAEVARQRVRNAP